jgi:mono/diheme cytochrome c family protein
VTEIPEHLLKRSKARKGGGDDPAAPASTGAAVEAAGSAAAAPAAGPAALSAAAAAIPADKPAAAAPPDPSYIAAAKARKKMPMWAMGLVACVPVWALAYAGTMQQPEVEDLLLVDAELAYNVEGGCAGCHGAGGGGGQGYAFANGEILATFPTAVDHIAHAARGSAPIAGSGYGDPERPGGPRIAGERGNMPTQAGLSLLTLELAVYHERVVLGGDDAESEANLAWAEDLRTRIEAGDEAPVNVEELLGCADPLYTPDATPENRPEVCPGGAVEGEEAAAAE